MDNLLSEIRNHLLSLSNAEAQKDSKRFFKEEINTLGIKVPVVNQVAKMYFPKGLSKEELWVLCEQLWQSGNMEESIIACNWSYKIRKQYSESDFNVFQNWIDKYVNNWASCDTLCNHTVGTLLEMFPDLVGKLETWAESDNRWMKRAAAVSLIIPARKGLFTETILKIADKLLFDKDDLVQKGYGWMLKACSEKDVQVVFDFVMTHKQVMPRTALRYAIEKMPANLKAEAMRK